MSLVDRYAAVLRGTGTAAPLAASILGRLPLGMTGLAVLLLVRQSAGSYAAAGAVSAAYALAFAAISPLRARTADRTGPVRVLALLGVVHPLALAALVALAHLDAPTLALGLAAVAAGATVPPIGAVMRALWGVRVPPASLTTAFALEAVVIELCFVAGPLMVAAFSATSGPGTAVLAAAALTLAGVLWLTRTDAVRAVRPVVDADQHVLGPLVSPAVRVLLLTVAAMGAGFGAFEVAMPAFTEDAGSRPSEAGVLLAVWSVGSMLGGVVYGAWHPDIPHRRQLPVLVGALAVGTALPALVAGPASAGPVLMGVALFVYGTAIAPFSACNSVLLSASAPSGTVTEAFAWNSSMIFGGAALGSAAAGVLVEAAGVLHALLLAAGTGAVALLLSLRAVRRLPVGG